MLLRCTAAALFAALSASAAAQPAEPLPAQLSALQTCRGKADAAERLTCYDKAVDALAAATASREVVVIDRAEVKRTRKGLFGFSLPKIPFLSGRSGDKEDEAEDARIVANIVEARALRGGMWRFTLEDGAVWETTEVSRGFDDPRPGAQVTIERGSFGAFHAVVGRRGRAAVRRVR